MLQARARVRMSEHPAGLVARRFVHAVVWGEHLMVWELLSPMARQAAIAVAERNGHDALASARARAGTWTDEEADMLLGDLVKGLRFDFSAVDVASISVGDVSVAAGPDGVRAIVPLTSTNTASTWATTIQFASTTPLRRGCAA